MPEDHTHHQLCVPVREAACGFVLRMFRDRDGSRCAVAFSSEERLRAVLGGEQRWIPLAEPALRDLAAPLGVAHLILDPNLIAPTVRDTPTGAPTPSPSAPAPVAAPAPAPAAAPAAAIAPAPAAASAPAAAAVPAFAASAPAEAMGAEGPAGRKPTAAAHRAPRWGGPGYGYNGVLRATVAVGAADLLLQLLS